MRLFFKELEFSLKDIKSILDDEGFDKEEALKVQRKLILEKKNRLEKIIESIDNTIRNMGEKTMSKKDFKAFSYDEIRNHQDKYKEETKQKYGKTDAYKESKEKTSKFSKNDWRRGNYGKSARKCTGNETTGKTVKSQKLPVEKNNNVTY